MSHLMYCPKCGEPNETALKYCRSCGLGLEQVEKAFLAEVRKALPDEGWLSEAFFGRLSKVFLVAFLLVGFAFLFSIAVYYKFLIFGAETMGLFGVFGFLLLGFLSLAFYVLKKRSARRGRFPDQAAEGAETAELEADLPALQPGAPQEAGSVTENTTRHLTREPRR